MNVIKYGYLIDVEHHDMTTMNLLHKHFKCQMPFVYILGFEVMYFFITAYFKANNNKNYPKSDTLPTPYFAYYFGGGLSCFRILTNMVPPPTQAWIAPRFTRTFTILCWRFGLYPVFLHPPGYLLRYLGQDFLSEVHLRHAQIISIFTSHEFTEWNKL